MADPRARESTRWRRRPAQWRLAWSSLLALAITACGNESVPPSSIASCDGERWVAAWTAAPQASTAISASGLAIQEIRDNLLYQQSNFPNIALAQVFSNQSLRQIVAPNLGGRSLRLRFGNRFQRSRLRLDDVFVGLAGQGAALVPGSNRPVTFGGAASVDVPAGEEVLSDPVELDFAPFQSLAISFHVPGLLVPLDYHLTAQQISYLSLWPGSHGATEDAAMFPTRVSSLYAINAVEVLAPASTGVVVALGDSLTDGYQSSYGSNSRWPDQLARRLQTEARGKSLSVVNSGISGNFLISDNPVFGPGVVTRFSYDVLRSAGVTDVLLLAGINDIGGGLGAPASVEEIIAAYRQIIAAAHDAGLRITGATLMPTYGTLANRNGWPGAAQQHRQQVNAWIRSAGAFDAVIDFDAAVRDPSDFRHIDPRYNSGDNLHLNDEGYRAMAQAIDLSLLKGRSCR